MAELICKTIEDYLNAGKIIQIKIDRTNYSYYTSNMNQYPIYGHKVIADKNLLRMGKDETVLINITQPPPKPELSKNTTITE